MTEMLLKDRLRDMTLRDYWLDRKEVIEDFEIEIDEEILYRCRKKHFPMIYPRLANMGCLVSEIEGLEPTSEYMNVRLYNAYKN